MPKYRAPNKKKPAHQAESMHHPHEECCPDDPCLIMLRKAAVAEREAILFYLEAAAMVCGELREEFLEIAADEMRHFAMIMRHIAHLDPVQAEDLEEEGLDVLLPHRGMAPKWAGGWKPACKCPMPMEEEIVADEFPPPRDMTVICLLTKALVSELEAVNMYQTFMMETENSMCCHFFCHLMNAEKHHVAELIEKLYELTGEPPSMENHD